MYKLNDSICTTIVPTETECDTARRRYQGYTTWRILIHSARINLYQRVPNNDLAMFLNRSLSPYRDLVDEDDRNILNSRTNRLNKPHSMIFVSIWLYIDTRSVPKISDLLLYLLPRPFERPLRDLSVNGNSSRSPWMWQLTMRRLDSHVACI